MDKILLHFHIKICILCWSFYFMYLIWCIYGIFHYQFLSIKQFAVEETRYSIDVYFIKVI